MKMPKIFGFSNIFKTLEWKASHNPELDEIEWISKIKIHGTNAGIRIDSDGVHAQKKTEDITIGDDNFGFALFVEGLKGVFLDELASDLDMKEGESVTILGEWAGPGVQKAVAVSQIPQKTFFVFGIFLDMNAFRQAIIDPDSILQFFDSYFDSMPETIKILPYYSKESCHIRDRSSVQEMVDRINEEVLKVEEVDPYIRDVYGIDGIGEGLVFYPVGIKNVSDFKDLMFKVKGEKHAVSKAGKPARIKSEIPENALQFVEMHVTENRLEQGAAEVGVDIKKTGAFIGWVCRDVATECAQEILESNLDWKSQLSGLVARTARDWFIRKTKEINDPL